MPVVASVRTSDPFSPRQDLIKPGTPVISLGGVELFVPALVFSQLKVIQPAIGYLSPILQEAGAVSKGNPAAGIAPDPFGALALMDTATLDRLMEMVHVALSRCYPNLTLSALNDMAIAPEELGPAFGVIMQQTHMYKVGVSQGGAKPGETQGAEVPPQISTGTSPITANVQENPGQTNSKIASPGSDTKSGSPTGKRTRQRT